jgi:hypothetical protein
VKTKLGLRKIKALPLMESLFGLVGKKPAKCEENIMALAKWLWIFK